MFNNITFLRYNTNNTELSRLIVPIVYGPKDKMVTRFESDPDLLRTTQVTLPRISFEIPSGGIVYDNTRKQNPLLRMAKGDSVSKVSSSFMGVPYDINFEMTVYTKNIDDGCQIIEQIMPYFNPDYTLTITPVQELGFLKDIPIILDNVTQDIRYEGNYDSVRYCMWTFTFTMKGYFFGPISTPKIIRKSIANIFNDPSLVRGYITKINLGSGNGKFAVTDTVYQGNNYDTATAYGIVNEYKPELNKLILGGVQGNFEANATIRGASTNAVYRIASFDATPLKLVNITVEPDPIDAEPDDDFGFTTTITEWPDTEN